MRSAFPDGIEKPIERAGQFVFDLHVAHAALAVPGFEIGDLIHIRIKRIVIREHGVAFHPARNIGADAVGVRVHPAHFFVDGLFIIRQKNRIAQALAHLCLTVRAHQRRHVADEGIGNGKHVAVVVVEPPRNFPRDFHMRLIVFAHRHEMGAGHQNIRALKHRIPNQAKRNRLVRHIRGARHLFHTRQPRHPGQCHQHLKKQIQLIDRGNRGLQVNGRFFRVDAHGQIIQDHVVDILPQGVDVFPLRLRGQGVQISHQKVALVLVLQGHAVFQGPHIVPQMQPPRGPITC